MLQAISIKGLHKTYRGRGRKIAPKMALAGIDLNVPEGSIFGLLGPNGAGKSTFINILAGLVVKNSGTVSINGYDMDTDPRRARASIGVVPQELNMDPFFRLSESLIYCAGLYGKRIDRQRVTTVMESLGLGDVVDSYPRLLSGGMRRRFLVAKAMIHDPPILVLDEPTAGVDVELRRQVWSTIRRLNRAGVTIILTTHYLEEAERLCDQIAIIQNGAIRICDATESLLRRVKEKKLIIETDPPLSEVPPILHDLGAACDSRGRLEISYTRGDLALARILEAIAAANVTIKDLSTQEADLEDVFLSLTTAPNLDEA